MALISLIDYAKKHGKAKTSVRQKALRGGFKTARKIGQCWYIDSDEPYENRRTRRKEQDKKSAPAE